MNEQEKKLKQLELLLLKKKQRGLNDLLFFNKFVLESSPERRDLIVPHVHGEWVNWFEGSEKRIRCILVPRSTFKSTFFTVGWSLQLLAKSQANRILIANATQNNAQKFLGDIRHHIRKNESFKNLYGDLYNKDLKWSEDEIEVVGRPLGIREPNVVATGVGGNIVSTHFDYIICDDLVNLENSATRYQSDKVIDWWKRSLSILEPHGTMLIIGTRWAYFELYSYLQDELHDEVDFYIRGAKNPDGSFYFPERFDEKKLNELKKLHGSYIYSAFYQNNPIDPDTAIIRPSQLRYFTEVESESARGFPVLPKNVIFFLAVDPAVSQKGYADFSGFVVVAIDENENWFVVETRREKVPVGEMIDTIFELNKNYELDSIDLEVIGQGQALLTSIQTEENRRGVYLPIQESKGVPQITKEQRIRATLQPLFERGKVYIKKDMDDLKEELLHFPKSKHDDLIDALASIAKIAYAPKPERKEVKETHVSKLEARLKNKDEYSELIDEFMGEDF